MKVVVVMVVVKVVVEVLLTLVGAMEVLPLGCIREFYFREVSGSWAITLYYPFYMKSIGLKRESQI